MKAINKKVICQNVNLNESGEHELNLQFDNPFVGKVTIKCRRFGRTFVLEIDTEGVEYL